MSRPWGAIAPLSGAAYSAAELAEAGDAVFLLDQRRLPEEEVYETYRSVEGVARAIRDMVVRGAPAIGIAAAYGLVVAAHAGDDLARAGALLADARPTAVNLRWAVERMLRSTDAVAPGQRAAVAAREARAIHREDVAACRAMGARGAEHLPDAGTILTHCNAGALATGGYGTALGVVRAARERGKRISVLADETRPYLQGARLTAWELREDGVPVTVITEGMAAHLMRTTEIVAVVVGADRVAANGDVANKIGTYGLACLAEKHGVPMYVAAPESTLDRATPSGAEIPIEERGRDEIAIVGGRTMIPDGVPVRHPAFDVTPAALVTALFTERATYRGAIG